MKRQGRAYVSTILFDYESVVLHDRACLHRVQPMTERDCAPRGCTTLLDDIGGAIHHIGRVHKYAREEDVPAHTVFVIITGGKENASRHYTVEQVKQLIEKKKEQRGWEFLFLGADIDAVETARHFGVQENRTATHCGDREGTKLNYEVIHEAVQ